MNARRKLIAITTFVVAIAIPISAAAAVNHRAPATTTSTTLPLPTQVNTITMPAPFDPAAAAPAGAKDLYHCALMDPAFTEDRYITKSLILPGNRPIVHHSILFLVSGQSAVAQARAKDANGKGWTCFGAPLSNNGAFDGTPWLGAGVPGNDGNATPAGTGVFVPAGSLLVLQVHYNLLGGTGTDQSSVELTTAKAADAATRLKKLNIDPLAAPVDLPCPKGTVRNPNPAQDLCYRNVSLNDLNARFGIGVSGLAQVLEFLCGHTPPSDLPSQASNTSKITVTCTLPLTPGTLRSITPHMHLLGTKFSASIVQGNSTKKLLSVPNYNFDAQVTYNLKSPVTISQGDRLTFSCTFNPKLRALIGQTKDLPPRYVTWGDGSSDEMCMAILGRTSS